MRKATVKIPAKINLTLDIEGVNGGYHVIESLVASVGLYDTITVKPVKEDVIIIKFSGVPIMIQEKKSNAYYAAEMFRKEYYTGGVEINVNREIPVSAGLGGSSADIAGVLRAMQKLFGVPHDLSAMAAKLGSDVNFMLKGGFGVLSDRGEKVEWLTDVKTRYYVLILKGERGVSTGECYGEFDKMGLYYPKNTPIAKKLMRVKDNENLFRTLKNDLYPGACRLCPVIEKELAELRKFCPAVMTGSGSALFGLFENRKQRDMAYKKLFPVFGERLVKTETVKGVIG